MEQGYWDQFGVRAAVDWCEPNYTVLPWIAEFWNTLSSIVIFVVGAYGAFRWWQNRHQLEKRFGAAFVSLAVIGLGSAAFHGTLLDLPQACDEIPMVWLGLICLYCMVAREPEMPRRVKSRWKLGVAAAAIAFFFGYFAFEGVTRFRLFLLTYGSVVAYVCITTWRVAFRESDDRRVKRLFWWSVVAYIGGFGLFWIPEQTLGCGHAFQAINPHAIFHLTSSVGPYAWILLATMDRLLRMRQPAVLQKRPIPFVTVPG